MSAADMAAEEEEAKTRADAIDARMRSVYMVNSDVHVAHQQHIMCMRIMAWHLRVACVSK